MNQEVGLNIASSQSADHSCSPLDRDLFNSSFYVMCVIIMVHMRYIELQ